MKYVYLLIILIQGLYINYSYSLFQDHYQALQTELKWVESTCRFYENKPKQRIPLIRKD